MFTTELEEVTNGWIVKIRLDLQLDKYIYEQLIDAQAFRDAQEITYHNRIVEKEFSNPFRTLQDAL